MNRFSVANFIWARHPRLHHQSRAGFSIIEIILAAAIFMILAGGLMTVILQGLDSNHLGEEQTVATQYATEGIEVMRSVKNQGFANLINTTATGAAQVSGVWNLSGLNNIFNSKYTRVLQIGDVYRDGSGNVVASGGTLDPLSKKVTSTVNWNYTPTRQNSVSLSEYLTNWKLAYSNSKGGMLVFGNGGTTTDTMSYQTFDSSGNWSSVSTTADVDGLTSNKALRASQVYASSTRNEKILLSRHYDGTKQYIYAQVFNGTSWGSVQLLSSWTAATFLDVQNFDGTYLQNGNFVAVYSDNTVIPKTATWNGSAWSGVGTAMTTLAGANIPNYVVARNRPGTNEIMAAFFTQGDTGSSITEYYSGSAWSAITSHAAASPTNTIRFIDFAWSGTNPLVGELIYANGAAAKSITGRIWTANGAGSGAWGTAVATTAQANNIESLAIVAQPNTANFIACDKDALAAPRIICYQSTSVPAWTNPTNPTLVSGSDTGIERSFHIAYAASSSSAISVYSDNTAVPKLKKYSPTTWDVAATTITTTPYTLGIVKTVTLLPDPNSSDIMALMTDANLDLYSVVWNASASAMYTTPAGKAFTQHGLNGSAITEFWYDFAWSNF